MPYLAHFLTRDQWKWKWVICGELCHYCSRLFANCHRLKIVYSCIRRHLCQPPAANIPSKAATTPPRTRTPTRHRRGPDLAPATHGVGPRARAFPRRRRRRFFRRRRRSSTGGRLTSPADSSPTPASNRNDRSRWASRSMTTRRWRARLSSNSRQTNTLKLGFILMHYWSRLLLQLHL